MDIDAAEQQQVDPNTKLDRILLGNGPFSKCAKLLLMALATAAVAAACAPKSVSSTEVTAANPAFTAPVPTREAPPTQTPTTEPTSTLLPPNPVATNEAGSQTEVVYPSGMIDAYSIAHGYTATLELNSGNVITASAVSLLVGAGASEEARTVIGNQLESIYLFARSALGDGVKVEIVATARHWAAIVSDADGVTYVWETVDGLSVLYHNPYGEEGTTPEYLSRDMKLVRVGVGVQPAQSASELVVLVTADGRAWRDQNAQGGPEFSPIASWNGAEQDLTEPYLIDGQTFDWNAELGAWVKQPLLWDFTTPLPEISTETAWLEEVDDGSVTILFMYEGKEYTLPILKPDGLIDRGGNLVDDAAVSVTLQRPNSNGEAVLPEVKVFGTKAELGWYDLQSATWLARFENQIVRDSYESMPDVEGRMSNRLGVISYQSGSSTDLVTDYFYFMGQVTRIYTELVWSAYEKQYRVLYWAAVKYSTNHDRQAHILVAIDTDYVSYPGTRQNIRLAGSMKDYLSPRNLPPTNYSNAVILEWLGRSSYVEFGVTNLGDAEGLRFFSSELKWLFAPGPHTRSDALQGRDPGSLKALVLDLIADVNRRPGDKWEEVETRMGQNGPVHREYPLVGYYVMTVFARETNEP